MNKRTIILIILSIFFVSSLYGQYDEFRKHQKSIFSNLDLEYISTGILYNAGIFNSDFQCFNSKKNDSLASWDIWRQAYMQIYTAYLKSSEMQSLEKIFLAINNNNEGNNFIPIGIINFEYEIIKDNALDDNLILYENNKLYNTVSIESPYRIDKLFVVSPLVNEYYTSDAYVEYFIPSNFYFSNMLEDVKTVEIDFDDGYGFQEVWFDQYVDIYYEYSGLKEIKTRITIDGKLVVCNSEIYIYIDDDILQDKSGDSGDVPVQPDLIIEQIDGCRLGIWYGCQDNQIKKPIVFIEGYDPVK